ncbi:MAG: hypothetical protein RL755_1645, partial [Pseudomonadota bacterium]
MKQKNKHKPRNNHNSIIEAKRNPKQTSKTGGTIADKIYAYRDQHAQALFSSLGRLVASRLNALLTVIVLSISISLACGFYLLIMNTKQLTVDL